MPRSVRALLTALLASAVASAVGSGALATEDRDGNPRATDRWQCLPAEGGEAAVGIRGGVIVFTDKAEFYAAAGVLTTETFEDEPWSATCDSGAVALIAFDDFTATSEPAALKLLREGCFGNHNTTQGGLRYLGADTDSAEASAAVTFAFAESLGAFGTYLVDLDSAALEAEIDSVAYPVPANGEGGVSWFGILSNTAFATVTFRIVGGTDTHYSFDDVAYGAPGGGPVSAGWDVQPRNWGSVKSAYRR